MEKQKISEIFERKIRTYGRKKSRVLSDKQKYAIEELYKKYKIDAVDFVDSCCCDDKLHDAETFVEIGFGRGEHLFANAIKNPDKKFIGCEPFENGVASMIDLLETNAVTNVSLYMGDARNLLERCAKYSISGIDIMFPDPWPKVKQIKRRLVSEEFVKILCKVLKKDGVVYFASDDFNYVNNVISVFEKCDLRKFILEKGDILQKPDGDAHTRYEQKAICAGRTCYYLRFISEFV